MPITIRLIPLLEYACTSDLTFTSELPYTGSSPTSRWPCTRPGTTIKLPCTERLQGNPFVGNRFSPSTFSHLGYPNLVKGPNPKLTHLPPWAVISTLRPYIEHLYFLLTLHTLIRVLSSPLLTCRLPYTHISVTLHSVTLHSQVTQMWTPSDQISHYVKYYSITFQLPWQRFDTIWLRKREKKEERREEEKEKGKSQPGSLTSRLPCKPHLSYLA